MLTETKENVIVLSQSELQELCGNREEKIRALQSHLDAKVVIRGNRLKIIGSPEDVDRTSHVIDEILQVVRRQGRMSEQQFRRAMSYAAERRSQGSPNGTDDRPTSAPIGPDGAAAAIPPAGERLSEIMVDEIPIPLKRRRLSPLTGAQRTYIQQIKSNTVTFGIGPAGTGKTYLAMAMAVGALVAGEVNRIILCRPAVEAGERLGFLPGDLAQKFDPYVRPLWDALYEMMEPDRIRAAIESGVIEIAPLAFMRGRTLNNAFVILDEGQNTSVEQMKMFLTRLGFDSRAVVTGDTSQVDLPRGQVSGLSHAERILSGIDDIAIVRFSNRDVVRHPLLMKVIAAYEAEKRTEGQRQPAGSPNTGTA